MFVISSYILNAQIGFRLPMNVSYVAGVVITGIYAYVTYAHGKKLSSSSDRLSDRTAV